MHPRPLLAKGAVTVAVIALAVAACSSPSSSGSAKVVTVIGTWAGDEQKNFEAMVKPWEDQTGNDMQYTGTRDINTVLTTGVASTARRVGQD